MKPNRVLGAVIVFSLGVTTSATALANDTVVMRWLPVGFLAQQQARPLAASHAVAISLNIQRIIIRTLQITVIRREVILIRRSPLIITNRPHTMRHRPQSITNLGGGVIAMIIAISRCLSPWRFTTTEH